MYNLLVTANIGAWDKLSYKFDKSRFLEYTTESIATAFTSLTPELISTLKSYPCIFAYEGYEKDFYIGKLNQIEKRGQELFIEFEFYPDIGPISFEKIYPISQLLDIRKWEMGRTHWAIKDEDLFDRLIKANILTQNLIGDKKILEKPAVREQSNATISTVKGFVGKVFSLDRGNDSEFFYRGHSNKQKYKLEPSLFRKDANGNYLYLRNEHILYRELIISNSSDFQPDEYTLDRLVRMQHYSLPTRLLDITSNPLIALYFSCKFQPECTSCKSQSESTGEVIIFSIKRNEIKYFDSDVVSCISNLARLPKEEKDRIDFDFKPFNEQTPIKRLVHHIREEKSYFESKIKPSDLKKIICVKGKQSNDRITSQSGAFLLFGHDATLDEEGTPEISVRRITVTNKSSILQELDLLNINESTVFPYIENSAKYVADKYKFNKATEEISFL
ncbi:FRG domain-containing protein [Pelagibaculum spongiae]|uniref:FRG domain-containing protein n=1 Tax=Pelagibaculum spongiae TaxID=2080658 RepID=A0A2V1GWL4_9GAMM|nr:FRG domain-containing protein [Pelagibaculum spongiae]PVZ65419.1 hypothetical protein DC094_18225 [Pelagibaculum spongiae]